MADKTKIEWTDHTFNPWWGCRRVSPACDNCYAAALSKRVGSVEWDAGQYRTFGDAHWQKPFKWDADAGKAGVRRKVFCASMADVFDVEAPADARLRLLKTISQTRNLDWQLLTKRPKAAIDLLPDDFVFRHGVWIGCTVESMKMWRLRVPFLQSIRARVRFLSIEPLLEYLPITPSDLEGISWVVIGGETGARARPLKFEWVNRLAEICAVAGVPMFFKQWGEHDAEGRRVGKKSAGRMFLGRTWDQFPEVTHG